MITLTAAAQKELKSLLDSKNAPANTGLRLSVEKGGCAGMSYAMKIADSQENDEIINLENGANVYLAADSLNYLKGCQVTYEYGLTDSGFKIINPNAARSCGCGTSFEAKGEEGTYDPANECK